MVTNHSDEYLKVTLEPTGQTLGRVRAGETITEEVGTHARQGYLVAEPAVGQGVYRRSPRFAFSHSAAWRWTLELQMGRDRNETVFAADLVPIRRGTCFEKKAERG